MKYLRLTSVRLAIGIGVLVVAAAIGWRAAVPARAAHVQIVLASDGALMVAGVPGRSMRAQIQDHRFWNGSSATSAHLVDFLHGARLAEGRWGTYDGRAVVIVDDHASFQIAKMLIASARESYPDVSYVDGAVTELPPVGEYLKDCSTRPLPPGCAPTK